MAVPLLFAALSIIVGLSRSERVVGVQKMLSGTALVINLLVALLILAYTLSGQRIVFQVGLWPAPYGITIFADALTGIMLTVVGLLSLLLLPYAMASLDGSRERLGYYPMALLLLMGANGAFITGDLFNLYVLSLIHISEPTRPY